MYHFGEITVSETDLHAFLKGLPKGEYGTTQIIEEYKKTPYCTQGVSPQKSWNANFGRILSQCSKDAEGSKIIKLVTQQRNATDSNNRPTTEAVWEIL